MTELVLHPRTNKQLSAVTARPSHAIMFTGQAGIGKATLAARLAEKLLALSSNSLEHYPYVKYIRSTEHGAIGIEQVRELEHFTALKIPGSKPIARIAIIEDAQLLTLEAQNALLKTLEEPPVDTAIILTTAHPQALLPTIRSRVQAIHVTKPSSDELEKHFAGFGSEPELKQALAVSGGLPGLITALLDKNTEHPLTEAITIARQLLQGSSYERLLKVDELARRKVLCQDVCFVLMQMAHTALSRSSPTARWQNILQAAYAAQEQLLANAQPKLVLTNLILQL